MPGPRGKGKAKSKPKPTPRPSQPSGPDPFVVDINTAEGWTAIVTIFCEHLNLPDLTTRHGLKKVHRDFDAIYRRLDRFYEQNPTNEKVVGGVIAIFSKMCADSILRNKLFKAGFISRLMPLLDMPACLHLGLRALSNVTHHGGIEARTDIARQTPVLIKLMKDNPDDAKIAELAIVTLSHAIGAVTGSSEDAPNMELVEALNIPSVLEMFVEAVRKPNASSYLIDHVLSFMAGATRHCYEACKACPPMLGLLVAGLRSKDSTVRSTCLGGLIRLHHHNAEPDQRFYDPQKAIAACRRGYPDHLRDILIDYGMNPADVTMTLLTMNGNQRVFMKCLADRDLYALGLSLVGFILSTEFSIVQGVFQGENPRTGALEISNGGLPFTYWDDALPLCAKAIREKRKAAEADAADILDIKYHILKARIPQAITLANQAIARNPKNAYFYYAITLGANGNNGLRAAKKGLKCKTITSFVRCALLQRAVDHAGDMGIRMLQEAAAGDKKWEEGVAFLSSAMEDAKLYMEEAPPDSRHMRKILYWYILLSLTMRGPEISPNLDELQDALAKLKFADDFAYFVGNAPAKTELRQTQQMVVSMYPDASKQWGEVIERFDKNRIAKEPEILAEKVDDDLAAWLDDLHLENGDHESHPEGFSHPVLNDDYVALYRCSYCGNPSAMLRKCSGCEKARYCDVACQSSHWADHKVKCSAAVKKT